MLNADINDECADGIKADLKEYTYGATAFIPSSLFEDDRLYLTRTNDFMLKNGQFITGRTDGIYIMPMCWVNFE